MLVVGIMCWVAAALAIGQHVVYGADPAVAAWAGESKSKNSASYMFNVEFDDDWWDDDDED